MRKRALKRHRDDGKVEHARLFVAIEKIFPAPENAKLYLPIDSNDPDIIALADSIKRYGVREPLVISRDNFILSGHRRQVAARLAGLREVPCRRLDISRAEQNGEFLKLLREYNRQRVKTRDEMLREEVISIDPDEAHRALSAYRRRKAKIRIKPIEIRESKRRKAISEAKEGFLRAIKAIIDALRDYWPLNARQIFYQLLNAPPLIHASKRNSRFRNNKKSWHALLDLLTRARHAGHIPYEVIDDPTRPVTIWKVFRGVADYYREEVKDILNGFWRDLMQSQSIHVEIVAEKNTVQGILRPVAEKFCIPLTIGRGQCSTRPLYNIAKRFRKSGKERLVIIAVSDLDPDGDQIAHSIGQRLHDDHHIENVDVVKAALTFEQVKAVGLPESYERAKAKSPNYKRYVGAYNTDFVWELEALDPKVLQKLLTDAIEGVIDRRAFNAECAAERKDAAHIAATREIVLRTLREHQPEEAA